MLSHSGAKVILLEDAAQAAKIASVRESLPELEHVIVLTRRGRGRDHAGRPALARRGTASVADERVAAVDPDDAATIVYTSGTTGPPKGCVLSHANLLYTAGAYIDRLELRDKPPIIFQYLPLAHVLARMVSFVRLDTGGTLAFWRGDTAKLAEDIAEAKPTHIPTVPRLLEKIHTRVVGTADGGRRREGGDLQARAGDRREGGEGQARGRLGRRARPSARHAVGRQARAVEGAQRARPERPGADHRRGADRHRGDRVLLRLRRARARGLRDDRDVRGGDAEHAVARCRSARVGRPLPGTEVSIADDGEILMRGPHIFKGYHRNEEATAEIIDGDGWLHSRRPRRDRRRLRAHHRPQEGPDHHLLGQERLARDARERAARDALDLAGDRGRRPALLPGGAGDDRPGRGAEARRGARRVRRPGVDGDRREGPRARSGRTSTRSTSASRGSSRSSASRSSRATSPRRRAS